MATDPEAWTTFAAALVAASSALAGLIFVALSINVERIIALAGLTTLALEGIVVLTMILLASIVVLVPGQSAPTLALELAVIGLGHVVIIGALLRLTLRVALAEFQARRILMATLNGLPGLLILVAGIGLASASLGGLYWLVPATILGLVAGIANAWVLLVEIKR